MDFIEVDPYKVKTLNNYVLVRFIDDDITKHPTITIVKRNNSSILRSQHVGEVLSCPDYIDGPPGSNTKYSLKELQVPGTIVAYNPMSVQSKIKWNGKIYNIIRGEDIIGILDGYVERSDNNE